MELRPWQLLPDEMRTKEVRKYYNILMKHRMWLEMKRVLDVIVAGIMLAVLIIFLQSIHNLLLRSTIRYRSDAQPSIRIKGISGWSAQGHSY